MSYKLGLNVATKYSPNFNFRKRKKKSIKFIIIHYTGMKKESDSIKRLCDVRSKVSSHFVIRRNGKVLILVPELYEAWHAGISKWKNLNSLNRFSIGIEVCNPGHKNGYKKFSKEQFLSIKKILKLLIKKYRINIKNILGHSDIAPSRKKDPGEYFPWKDLAKIKLSHWHSLNLKRLSKLRKIRLTQKDELVFLKNLYKIGYSKMRKINPYKNMKYLTIAFQRRFRQDLINGKIDKECLVISKNLIKS